MAVSTERAVTEQGLKATLNYWWTLATFTPTLDH
jgi:hypothetical protein